MTAEALMACTQSTCFGLFILWTEKLIFQQFGDGS